MLGATQSFQNGTPWLVHLHEYYHQPARLLVSLPSLIRVSPQSLLLSHIQPIQIWSDGGAKLLLWLAQVLVLGLLLSWNWWNMASKSWDWLEEKKRLRYVQKVLGFLDRVDQKKLDFFWRSGKRWIIFKSFFALGLQSNFFIAGVEETSERTRGNNRIEMWCLKTRGHWSCLQVN